MLRILALIILGLMILRVLFIILKAFGINIKFGWNQTTTIINGEVVEDTKKKKNG